MKDYCTQNNGDCSTCSLVNYNRDCQNNPLHGGSRPGSGRPAVEDKKIARSIKFSDPEWETVKEKASSEGVSASEYVRNKVLD